jgi:hypothetical protein
MRVTKPGALPTVTRLKGEQSMNETPRANRWMMAILLVVAGLFMIAVATFLVQSTLIGPPEPHTA